MLVVEKRVERGTQDGMKIVVFKLETHTLLCVYIGASVAAKANHIASRALRRAELNYLTGMPQGSLK
jgi:hypothetical protein